VEKDAPGAPEGAAADLVQPDERALEVPTAIEQAEDNASCSKQLPPEALRKEPLPDLGKSANPGVSPPRLTHKSREPKDHFGSPMGEKEIFQAERNGKTFSQPPNLLAFESFPP
jgi:hypothetical protein